MLKEKHFNKKKEGEFYIQVLAENLKNIRDHFDISQEELAEAAQISVNEVSKIERKIINPGLATLVALDSSWISAPCLLLIWMFQNLTRRKP